MAGTPRFAVAHETIRLGSAPDKPRLVVIRSSSPAVVAAKVTELGGRIVASRDDAVLVVELPAGVTAQDVGADEIQERRLSTMERSVTATWRPVAAAS